MLYRIRADLIDNEPEGHGWFRREANIIHMFFNPHVSAREGREDGGNEVMDVIPTMNPRDAFGLVV